MNKKIWIIGALVLLFVVSTGCGQKPLISSDPVNGSDATQNQTPAKVTTETIAAYYTDEEMLDLNMIRKEISYEVSKDKYLEAVKTLQSSGSAELFPLWEKVIFRSAKLVDGKLVVDISLPDEARLGASGELLALDSLKNTIFQFSEVQSIDLLVDGQKVESLMGHEILEYPMTRN